MNGQQPTPAVLKSPTADNAAPAGHPPNVPDHELLRRIGSGSYGEVWLARNVLGRLRAVKIIYRSRFQDPRPFEREFEGIQRFEPISRSHPSQLAILHVGKDAAAGCFYYVMELADSVISNQCSVIGKPSSEVTEASGIVPPPKPAPLTTDRLTTDQLITDYSPHTLRHDIEQHGRLAIPDCVQIGLSLATALAHLHQHGLVHRDIKPSNVIFVNGVPKLGDIGLVTEAGDTQSIVGTEGYIPPEGPGTPQADLYSLGKVLYEISTGLDRRRFAELPEDLRTWPDRGAVAEFNQIVLKACAKDPTRRYRSAEELHADLALLERGQSLKQRRMREQQLTIAKRILVAGAILMLLTAGVVMFSRKLGRTDASIHSEGSLRQQAENPEVTMLCKLGRFHYYKITEEGFAKGMECFNRALEIDPRCVSAYAGIADLCAVSQPSQFLPPKAAEEKMRWARDKLMAIDSRLAEGHAIQGYIHLAYDWKPGEAKKELKLALEFDQELLVAHIWRAKLLAYTRNFDEAEQEYKKAQQLDPTRYGLNVNVGVAPFFARRYDRAIQYFEKAIEVLPNQDWAMQMMGRAYEEKGDYPAAIAAFQKADLAPGDKPEFLKPDVVAQTYAELRGAYDKAGQDGYWQKKLEFAQSKDGRWIAWVEALDRAQLYAHLGYSDEAFHWLDRAFQEKSELLLWLNVDPGWDKIRSDPRFVALLKKMGLAE